MGGAYTALADDPSGTYFNPAGVVHGQEREVSISGNAYYSNTLVYEEAVRGEDFKETASGVIPTFLGGTTKIGKRLALSYAAMTLDSRNIDQNNKFTDISNVVGEVNSFHRTHQENNNLLLAGAGASWMFAESFSLGMSVFYYQRSIVATNHQLVQFNGGAVQTVDQKYTTSNEGGATSAGVQVRMKNFAFGLAWKQFYALTDKTMAFFDVVKQTPNEEGGFENPQVSSVETEIRNFNELETSTARGGIAWIPSPSFLLSADVLFHPGISTPYNAEGGTDLVDTFNYSLGMEGVLGQHLIVRTGVFSNNSGYPILREGGKNQAPHIDYLGGAFGFGWKTKQSDVSIGVVGQFASGKAQIISESTEIQNVKGNSVLYLWSSKFAL